MFQLKQRELISLSSPFCFIWALNRLDNVYGDLWRQSLLHGLLIYPNLSQRLTDRQIQNAYQEYIMDWKDQHYKTIDSPLIDLCDKYNLSQNQIPRRAKIILKKKKKNGR